MDIIHSDYHIVEEKFILIYPIIKIICNDILFNRIDRSSSSMNVTMTDIHALDKCYNIVLNRDVDKEVCVTNHCSWKPRDMATKKEDVDDMTLIKMIIADINDNIPDASEEINEDEFTTQYIDYIPKMLGVIKILYGLIYINCKQPIYELEEHYYDNLIYKFTYSIINNYIIQTSILEGRQFIKNELRYIVKTNEIKFDQDDITSNNINILFKKSMEYNYIREKNIVDYFIHWNNNSHIRIYNIVTQSISTAVYDIKESDDSVRLVLDMADISFLHNIMMVDDTLTSDAEYTIEPLVGEELIVLQ
tara:strand:- start:2425 stop:3339 length:915 start_codon:yes stop_codon:yes gene_type:complete